MWCCVLKASSPRRTSPSLKGGIPEFFLLTAWTLGMQRGSTKEKTPEFPVTWHRCHHHPLPNAPMAATTSVQESPACDTQAENSPCFVPAPSPAAPSSLTPPLLWPQGYNVLWNLPWQIPLALNTAFHDFHHSSSQKPVPVCTWWDKFSRCIRHFLQRKIRRQSRTGIKTSLQRVAGERSGGMDTSEAAKSCASTNWSQLRLSHQAGAPALSNSFPPGFPAFFFFN